MAKNEKAAAPEAAAAQAEDWDTAPAATTIKADDNGIVKVRCVVKTKPWTDTKALEEGEEASVSLEVAGAMFKNGQVEIL